MMHRLFRNILGLSVVGCLVLHVACCASGSGGGGRSADRLAVRSQQMMNADLDYVLERDAAWQATSTMQEQVGRLWELALELEGRGRYDIAAAAIARMIEIDPSLSESEVLLVKLIDLHNEAVRHPLRITPPPR